MMIRFVFCVSVAVVSLWGVAHSPSRLEDKTKLVQATNPDEARSRALLLYELAQGSLQVMHRDFFDKDNTHAIPSASLEDVFKEMDKSFGVKMKWLTVNTDVVNFEHEAETDFEKAAVKILASGENYAEETGKDEYLFAGAISLRSQCLGCHLKSRKSTNARTAGLVISIPIESPK